MGNSLHDITLVLGSLASALAAHKIIETKRIIEEFWEIKNTIYSTTSTEFLFPELSRMKHFFNCNPKFLKIPENNNFFHNWLMKPSVDEASFSSFALAASNRYWYWKEDKITEMFQDLETPVQ